MRSTSLPGALLMAAFLMGCPPVEPTVTEPPPADAGTENPPPPPPPPEPLTLQEVCAIRAVSELTGGGLCVQRHVPSALDYDAARIADWCRPGTDHRVWAERLLAAHNAGKLELDWGKARTCLDSSRAMRAAHSGVSLITNPEWAALRDGACREFFVGKVASGAACEDDWECAGPSQGCFTMEPWKAGSRVCAPYATEGQACNAAGYYLCAEGLFCNETEVCEVERSGGAACTTDEQCASGTCIDPDDTGGACAAEATKQLGEACAFTDQCAGYEGGCVTCRADATGADTCQLLGGEGAACTTWEDCVYDLGCTNGVCTTVGEGALCEGSSYGVCNPGLRCIPAVDCPAITDQAECDANAHCQVLSDAGGWACVTDTGTCAALPETGPCAGLGSCAFGHYCDRSTDTCVPRADVGEACASFNTSGPPCREELVCVFGTCRIECESDLDCTNGEVCHDSGNEDVRPICGPKATVDCAESAECGEGNYCLHPVDVCTAENVISSCEANPDCDWDATQGCFPIAPCDLLDANACGDFPNECAVQDTAACLDKLTCVDHLDETACTAGGCSWNGFACENACAAHNGDEAACSTAPGCVYESGPATCVSVCGSIPDEPSCTGVPSCQYGNKKVCTFAVDCATFPTDTECLGAGACTWRKAHCTPAPDSHSACRPQLAAGEPVVGYCQIGQELGVTSGYGLSEACLSNACYIGTGQAPVCLERSNYGCVGDDATGLAISLSFLFGFVWLQRKRR